MKKYLSYFNLRSCAQSQKGFTLMEILAVLLIIAVILSFAIPAYNSIRFDQRNNLAKEGVKRLSEAIRSYYQNTKGVQITGNFTGTALGTVPACNDFSSSGVPGRGKTANIMQLFACGYLSGSEYSELPYTFYSCLDKDTNLNTNNICHGRPYAVAMGTTKTAAGEKYVKDYNGVKYYIYLDDALRVTDNSND